MKDASSPDPVKQARDALGVAHADLTAATKRAIGDDGKILFGAASAIDLAVEFVTPPNTDRTAAAQNCREALKLVKVTRAYAQRESGGDMAKVLDRATKSIEGAVKFLES